MGKFDGIISSDLKRAIQTAKISFELSEKQNTGNLIIDERFKEANLGNMEGIDCSRMSQYEHETIYKIYLKGKMLRDDIEQPGAVLERVKSGLAELENNKNYILFSHFGVMKIWMYAANVNGIFMNNCGVLGARIAEDGSLKDVIGYWDKNFESERA